MYSLMRKFIRMPRLLLFFSISMQGWYNTVSGLDNAKQIWDTLKISHECNNATMITKMESVEGELGRFAMKRGEEPTEPYNRLKTLVNKIQSYESTRWMDHDIVRLMLRTSTIIDPHLVKLIRENPMYTKMTPEEILGKFVSGRMMVKEARYVDDIANGPLTLYEPQPVALKATSSKEALPNKVAQSGGCRTQRGRNDACDQAFQDCIEGTQGVPNKNKSRDSVLASNVVSLVTLLHNAPIMKMTRDKKREGRRRRRRTIGRQRARLTSARSGTQTARHPTPTMRGLLLLPSTSPPSSPTSDILASCLRIRTRDTTKYTSSSDEDSDDDVDYSDIFKGIDRSKVDKINELIDAFNEKDRLLEKQGDILYEEHDKLVDVEKSLALEVKK
jgi:hypothetical protein